MDSGEENAPTEVTGVIFPRTEGSLEQHFDEYMSFDHRLTTLKEIAREAHLLQHIGISNGVLTPDQISLKDNKMVINKLGGDYHSRYANFRGAVFGYAPPEQLGMRQFIHSNSQKLTQVERDEKVTTYSWGALAYKAFYGKGLPFVEKCAQVLPTFSADCVEKEYKSLGESTEARCGSTKLTSCVHYMIYKAISPSPEKRPRLEDIYNLFSRAQEDPSYAQ